MIFSSWTGFYGWLTVAAIYSHIVNVDAATVAAIVTFVAIQAFTKTTSLYINI